MKKLWAKQEVRFLMAGSVNTAIDFVLLNVLTLAFGVPVLLANTISVCFGICISYALNHFFVFRYPYRITWRKFVEFFLVTGFSSLVLQNVVIVASEWVFETRFGNSLLLFSAPEGRHFFALNIAKLAAILLGLVWNFLMYRFVVFRQPAVAVEKAKAPATDAAPSSLLPTE